MAGKARLAVRLADKAVSWAAVLLFSALLALGCYGLWDSSQAVAPAEASVYARWKPGEEKASFEDLRALNPEVIGWLTVSGTNIDYPLTQGKDNSKYINTAADGSYALSGSIFLDCRNSPEFRDFVSILYGHDMAEKKMFGGLADFADREYFQDHKEGTLYFGGEDHKIEFFAFLAADAYDLEIYRPGVLPSEGREYGEFLLQKALHRRQTAIRSEDHLILLSTCAAGTTNGRWILAGKLAEETKGVPDAERNEE